MCSSGTEDPLLLASVFSLPPHGGRRGELSGLSARPSTALAAPHSARLSAHMVCMRGASACFCTCVRVCTRTCVLTCAVQVCVVCPHVCALCVCARALYVCALVYTRACVCAPPHSCHPTRRQARRRQIGTDFAPDSCFPRPRPLWAPPPLSLPPLPPQLLPTSAELSVADPRTEPWSEGPHPRPYSPGQVPPRQASSSLSSPGGLRTQRTNQRALESVPSSPHPRWPLSAPPRACGPL